MVVTTGAGNRRMWHGRPERVKAICYHPRTFCVVEECSRILCWLMSCTKNARAYIGLGREEGRVDDGRGVWRCGQGCGDGEADMNAVFNNDGDRPSSLLGGCELWPAEQAMVWGEQRRGHLIRRRGQLTRASDPAPGKRKMSILNFFAAVERRCNNGATTPLSTFWRVPLSTG